eukprot:COSAG01_NODE_29553_length_634_cov_90.822430_1_plen_54_part_01
MGADAPFSALIQTRRDILWCAAGSRVLVLALCAAFDAAVRDVANNMVDAMPSHG